MEVTVFVAGERYEATYDPDATHPNGHILSLEGQGHVSVACDCPKERS